ncbi:alpha/beta hydrolase [Rhodopirellula sp. SWK7]|uniref:alpha/beta hydrolase n=1 Tax=Rhodopirellula sp. SWK7 TaxID=595460 RepID=UPI0002BF05D0|nr:alpha/beta hydrolase [Rhodopirellula sp. SWK7]EMI45077.1 lipase/esterase [Rhodopirellula sp. SWK7]
MMFARLQNCVVFLFLVSTAFSPLASIGMAGDTVAEADGGSAEAVAQATVEDSFIYKQVEHEGKPRDLRIDWTRPSDWQAGESRGAVVFFHGGGWVGGEPGPFAKHSQELAELGLVCFRVEYRLLDRKGTAPPDVCIADAQDAFRFVRGNAKRFGIDANRIASGGGSAGGHLAAYLGMMDDEIVDGVSRKPNALLLFNPVYDNGPGGWGTKRVGDRYQEYSPAHNITADDPPAIVFLGDSDRLIPVTTAERFQRLSREAGLKSELRTYAGQPHGFFNVNRSGGKYYRETLGETITFLRDAGWMN